MYLDNGEYVFIIYQSILRLKYLLRWPDIIVVAILIIGNMTIITYSHIVYYNDVIS